MSALFHPYLCGRKAAEWLINMQRLCAHEFCTGCSACANACPKGCIRMEVDEEGFLYPQIDEAACISCNRCNAVCPVLAYSQDVLSGGPKAYAAHNRDEAVVCSSSSGGVFTALARNVLEKGGVVYGAAFQKDFSVAHCRVESIDELHVFQGSKYAQSNIRLSYQQVREDLKAGRKVLFSGTPCQVVALRSFLVRNYEDLLCVDIICHSVPSPYAWQAYLRQMEKESGGKVEYASFRDKRDGWQHYYLCTRLSDGTEMLRGGGENYYMKAFIQGLSTRPSCYNCKFKGQNRGSDITLGDFWGVEKACPEAFYKKGTSLVLIQSEKGQAAFDETASHLELLQVDSEAALQGNPAYYFAFQPHRNREIFFRQLGQEPLEDIVGRLLASTKKGIWKQRWSRSLIWRRIRKIRRIL